MPMNYRSVALFQKFIDEWKEDLDQGYTDGIVQGRYLTDAVVSLYREVKKTEAQYAQDEAIENAYRARAFDEHHRDGECEIDDGAVVSLSEDGGAYVQSWVWVYGPVQGEDYAHDLQCSEGDH